MWCLSAPQGDHVNSDEEDLEVDPDRDRAEEEAEKQRKRAGLPELELDALPSSNANKMMSLDLFYHDMFTRFPKYI